MQPFQWTAFGRLLLPGQWLAHKTVLGLSTCLLWLVGCGGSIDAASPMVLQPDGSLIAGAVKITSVGPQDIEENQEVLVSFAGDNLSAVQSVMGEQMQCGMPEGRTEHFFQLRCRAGPQGSEELSLWILESGRKLQRWRGLRLTISAARSGRRLTASGASPERCFAAGTEAWVPCDSEVAKSLSPVQDGMRQATASRFAPVASAVTGQAYPLEDCVVDLHTSLVWEGKTHQGWRAAHRLFTNYLVELYDPLEQASYDGNVDHYLARARQQGICGYFDWRLPSPEELQGLLDYGQAAPALLTASEYFPNAPPEARYWSGLPYAESALLHWFVDFSSGVVSIAARQEGLSLRLVRGPGRVSGP